MHGAQRIKPSQSGFTLLEVMIATLIFVFAFLPVVDLYSTGLEGSDNSEGLTLSLQAAQKTMEEMLGLGYDALLPGAQKIQLKGLPLFENVLAVSPEDSSGVLTVTQVYFVNAANQKSDSDTGIKQITVNAVRKEKDGRYAPKVTLRSLLAGITQ